MKKVLINILLFTLLLTWAVVPCFAVDVKLPFVYGDYVYYYDTSGIYTAEVKDGITWLCAAAFNQYAWFGLDNSDGVFKEGSTFHVRLLTKESNAEAFSELFKQVNATREKWMREDAIGFLEVGVTDPSGEEYGVFPNTAPLYVQLGDCFTAENIEKSAFAENEDEDVPVSITNLTEGAAPLSGSFAKISLKHAGTVIYRLSQRYYASVFTSFSLPLTLICVGLLALAGYFALKYGKKKSK